MTIKKFLEQNPSMPMILKFIEEEAQRIANQRKMEQEKSSPEVIVNSEAKKEK